MAAWLRWLERRLNALSSRFVWSGRQAHVSVSQRLMPEKKFKGKTSVYGLVLAIYFCV